MDISELRELAITTVGAAANAEELTVHLRAATDFPGWDGGAPFVYCGRVMNSPCSIKVLLQTPPTTLGNESHLLPRTYSHAEIAEDLFFASTLKWLRCGSEVPPNVEGISGVTDFRRGYIVHRTVIDSQLAVLLYATWINAVSDVHPDHFE